MQSFRTASVYFLVELCFEVIVVEILDTCIEIVNCSVILHDVISHFFAFAGVEDFFFVKVVFAKLFNALAVSFGASGKHSLVTNFVITDNNVINNELIGESLLENFDI